ncbi:MAG: PD40 domain-containing protein [Verrucomicrobia bacterium]|nr:PD40 domain-containing protein [Verrucomicrobiota bacterium]
MELGTSISFPLLIRAAGGYTSRKFQPNMRFTLLSQLSAAALALSAALPVSAQLPPPTNAPIFGARMPALSPHGDRIAFAYRGDLWIADLAGGRARPLTSHVETDHTPLFSPDGRWVAFSSKRSGSWDLYAVPAEGGPTRQLTWHSGTEQAFGWRPDGKYLLFSSRRDTPHHSLYALDVSTLRSKLLTEDFAPMNYPSYSPDGKTVVYGRYGFHWTRPRYVGSAAAQIWLLNVADGKRRALTHDDRQHLWTKFLPDGEHLLTVTIGETTPSVGKIDETIPKFIDNPQRTPNLWVFDLEGQGKQLTFLTGGAVRCPSVATASGDIAFEYGPDLWLMKKGSTEPEKLRLFAAVDDKQTNRRREKLAREVTEAEPSPDGKTVAFGLRGDIWTVAVEKPKGIAGRGAEFARRLTDWAGDDSDFYWAPDGKRLFFTSDREFYSRLFEVELDSLKVKPVWARDSDVSRLSISPDGKWLGFWASGKEGGLYLLRLETGETRRLVTAPGPQWRGQGGGGDFAWSPDMQWMAYAMRGESKAWNIWIMPASGGEARNVTQLYAHHGQPCWSADGKFLYFQSNREGGGALYVLPLTREHARSIDMDFKFEKPTNAVKVTIEFEDLSRRIRKFASQEPQADLTAGPDGTIVFLSENDLWSVTYDGKETKRLTTGGGKAALRLSKDGKKAFYMANGEMFSMALGDKKEEKITFTAEWERDVRAERLAAFRQFWKTYQRGYYDANFHGRDWVTIRQRYEPFLDAVDTGDEFASLLHTMVGELETSHAEVTSAATAGAPVTPHLGFTFDYSYRGPGLRVGKVPPGAPGSFTNTAIKSGEYIWEINGREITLNEKLYEWINDKQDREFEFLVSTNASRQDARKVKYKVLTQEEWNDLNYRNRTERLRKYVTEKSDGRFGYLHISAMGANNQAQFEREAYEYIVGKEAMVIDVRFNNGGNIADTLIEWLSRKPHGYTRPRDGAKEPTPFRAWDRKIIVLMNEHSYSNGEIFPCEVRTRGLGQLVGMPTPGYVIWTDSLRLVDGTNARLPLSGAFRLDGTNMENIGEQPDVRVPLTAEDWLAERDPQLDKAIEMLMTKD